MTFVVTLGDRTERVEVSGHDGRYRVTIGGEVWHVDARLSPQGFVSLLAAGASWVADVTSRDGVSVVEVDGEAYTLAVEEATRHTIRTHGGTGTSAPGQTLRAPLPGRVAHVAVRPGDRVERDAPLVVIEAMKMENEFRAEAAGTVLEVRVEAGQAVNAGDVLVVIGP
jgi:3-methylcrotonyl-CoA carboxylase alpha subunit